MFRNLERQNARRRRAVRTKRVVSGQLVNGKHLAESLALKPELPQRAPKGASVVRGVRPIMPV